MNTIIRYATLQELPWLMNNERHIDSDKLRAKIKSEELIIAQEGAEVIGWLRYGFFWDSIPFLNMLFVDKRVRGSGIGRKLVDFWENEMKKKKYELVMTSSQSDEDGQFFYRRLGFIDSGVFELPGEVPELVFYKNINA